ncbi:DUF6090 family protein [Robertkochia flava]|uniref:DUF6090 family protein n=1 Tax=Robertkochia flava TaxID=3447986 RepID=UPI001CD03704|nr:DUF6090 family protein [Robertkochia marina]
MITFLRSIRRKLLDKQRFSKYVLYALGEIALVVIGILIALQVNNWNEHRKNEREQIVFLNNLFSDLKNDLGQLDSIITYQSEKLRNLEALQTELQTNKDFEVIEQGFIKNQTSSNDTFFANTGTYTTAISSGTLANLQPDSLKITITNLYQRYYYRLNYNGEVYDKRNDQVAFQRGKFFDKINLKLTGPEVIDDSEFLNLITILIYDNTTYVKLATRTRQEIRKVMNRIENRLKT